MSFGSVSKPYFWIEFLMRIYTRRSPSNIYVSDRIVACLANKIYYVPFCNKIEKKILKIREAPKIYSFANIEYVQRIVTSTNEKWNNYNYKKSVIVFINIFNQRRKKHFFFFHDYSSKAMSVNLPLYIYTYLAHVLYSRAHRAQDSAVYGKSR